MDLFREKAERMLNVRTLVEHADVYEYVLLIIPKNLIYYIVKK